MYLNTSNVILQYEAKLYSINKFKNLNTSNVILQFPTKIFLFAPVPNLNTSNVILQYVGNGVDGWGNQFKYI